MKIECAQRFRPFCHLPGTYFILPGTSFRVQLFPTYVKAEDLSGPLPRFVGAFSLPIKGPVEKFTVLQNLERRELCVWGGSQEGFMRYRLREKGKCIQVRLEKLPTLSATPEFAHPFLLDEGNYSLSQEPALERLALGNHKAQDWELIRRRADFTEIFPLWHALGQMTPAHGTEKRGTAALLQECAALIDGRHPEKILDGFSRLWLAGFESGLSPRLNDEDFQGIVESVEFRGNESSSPLQLLTEGYRLIRSLFLQERGEALCLLPALPPAFHCGRLLQARCEKGLLQIEWTKKAVRRVCFTASCSGNISFCFFQGEKRCRVRQGTADPGRQLCSGEQIAVSAGTLYWLDRFQR
jgi:hypothetical protein